MTANLLFHFLSFHSVCKNVNPACSYSVLYKPGFLMAGGGGGSGSTEERHLENSPGDDAMTCLCST